MNIGNAVSYYEEAGEYCSVEAQKRLEKCSQYLLSDGKATSSQSTKDTHKELEPASRQFKLVGPYFSALPSASSTFVPTSASLSQESFEFTINDVPSTIALANMFRNANEGERQLINTMIDKIIQQFDVNSSSKESIQELAVLAAIPDQQMFRAIISQLLKVEKDSQTFSELTIYGLAVILTSISKEIDLNERQGFLSDFLARLNYRLSNIGIERNNEELLTLLRALSILFDAMLCSGMRHLGRLEVFIPINDKLSELTSDESVDLE
ncbi:hypothetical protein BGZ76_004455, partial [Entomortierella beljakovae]